MHFPPRSRHHMIGGLPRARRSSPVGLWTDYSEGNPSGIFIGPDGEIITSSGDGKPAALAPPNSGPIPNIEPPSGQQTTGGGSLSDIVPPAQTSGQMMKFASSLTPVGTSTSGTSLGSDITNSSATSQPSEAVSNTDLVSTSTPGSAASSLIPPTTQTTSTSTITPAPSASTSTSAPAPATSVSSSSSQSTSNEKTVAATATATTPPRVNSTSSSDPSNRATSFYIGVAFAAIAGIGFVVAVFAWWLRIRSRTRRRKLNNMTAWPWDHDRLGGRQLSLEGGLGIHGYDTDMLQHSLHPSPTVMSGTYGGDGSVSFPHPPPPAHTLPVADTGSPYVTVSLHGAHQSVPDLAPALGVLQIANIAPGDRLSSGSGSEAECGRALGPANTYPAGYGTPFMPRRPCFLGVADGGLDVPWAPLRVRRSETAGLRRPAAVRGPESNGRWMEQDVSGDADMMEVKLDDTLSLEMPLPYPGDLAVPADAHSVVDLDEKREGWAASIRSNLLSAYNAVVGASPAQVAMMDAGDAFTRAPQRIRKPLPQDPREASLVSLTSSTPQEVGNRTSVSDVPAQDPFADNLQVPLPAATASLECSASTGLLCPPQGPLTRASSIYSTDSVEAPAQRVCDDPPRLPSIASLTQSMDDKAGPDPQVEDFDGSAKALTRLPHASTQSRKKTRRHRRPTLLTRKSSSQASAASEMSRTSTEELTDGERFAKDALRARRRRIMEMSVGRGRTRRAKATTLSRRRSTERVRQRRAERECQ
ncbi:hypothetical protein C8Q79DRAFT_1004377 [Trametes meyenii]|nr:hypothetical protein C8Q79DRAFT_1004377 [Trametes meyenii]